MIVLMASCISMGFEENVVAKYSDFMKVKYC